MRQSGAGAVVRRLCVSLTVKAKVEFNPIQQWEISQKLVCKEVLVTS